MAANTTTIFPSNKGRRLVLSAVPYQGHINPMIQLANVLDSKGFTVIFILTQSTPLDHSKHPNLIFHRIPDGLSEEESATLDVSAHLYKLNVNLVQPFLECLVTLMSEEPVSCLITDANWYFTQDIADSLHLPRIAFRTASVCSFLAYDALPLFRQKGYLSREGYKPEDEVEEFPPLKVKDIPNIKKSDPEVLWLYIENMMKSCKAASGLLFNSFEELEGTSLSKITHTFGVKTFAIGPLHKYFPASSSSLLIQDPTALSWLDTQAPNSVIYVSFGSIAEMEKSQLIEIASGLANSKQPFLWVIRPGSIQKSNWVQGFLDDFLNDAKNRGYLVNWAPQQEVLCHPALGGFWTHSGWNSILESLCEGVPMICSPFFGDQMVNARFVSEVWKVGLLLEKGFDKVEIEDTIRKLMREKEGEEIRGRVISLRDQIDVCFQGGGSSCQSMQNFIDYIVSL